MKMLHLILGLVLVLAAAPAPATVPSTSSSATYGCNGVTTAYAAPFRFLAAGDLAVTKTIGDTVTTLALTTDYTVSGAGATSGTVTLVAGSRCASGYTLTIKRTVALTQGTSLKSTTLFTPQAVESALDKVTMGVQQVDRRVGEAEAKHSADMVTQDARDDAQDLSIGALLAGGGGGTGGAIPVVNPVSLGADSTGAVNSRVAIQTALDAGLGQPVIVYLPQGHYKVFPAADADGLYPGNDCLRINYSNVWLVGAGMGSTTISCYPAGGTSPATTWEVLDSGGTPTAWRGRGIVLAGSAVFENPQRNVVIKDLRLTGNSVDFYTLFQFYGGPAFPADPVTGANWDLTNQGIHLGNGTAVDDLVIDNVEIDHFQAELVYYGGAGCQDLFIRNSKLHDSIGSIVSLGCNLRMTGTEIWHGYNAVENTPNVAGGLRSDLTIRDCDLHDNVIGIVVTTNAAPVAAGKQRILIERNRIWHNYRGAVWVRGGIIGMAIRDNDVADCGQGTDACIFIATAYGYAPEDITIERNVLRAETTFTGQPIRVAQDAGYPMKNIRVIGNRVERSKYIQDGGGVFGGSKSALWDATSTVYIEDNDFSRGGAAPWAIGDSVGSGDQAVPFFGVTHPNKWSIGDSPGTWGFTGNVAATTMSVRPSAPLYQLATPSAGWNTVTALTSSGIPSGQRSLLYVNAGDATRGVYLPATGTGWRFRRPYWLTAWGNHGQYPMLAVRFIAGVWVEDAPGSIGAFNWDAVTFHPDLASPPNQVPQESNAWWLSGESADTYAPTIPFYWTSQVELAPSSARVYTAFSNAPPGEPLTVKVNANVTINASATIKTAGGASFAPGGTGGVIVFVNPKGATALYEVSRFIF